MPARKAPKDDPDQQRRFIEAAQEAGCSEDESAFDEALRRIAKAKPARPPKRSEKGQG